MTQQKSVYAELCEMFGKESVDYSIAEAQGKAPCTCGMKNADKCQAKKHAKSERQEP